MGGWKTEVVTDPITGLCTQSETFQGNVKMEVKQEQLYLGDLISADGSQTKNVQLRRSKGFGIINQIMQILESTYFGKYFFEVAMVLRDSLFLSSLLLNSEAWVNYSEKDVRILEQCDEILLTKVLDCDANTSNAIKYLDLGILPIRFEIMRRKLSFLQYILLQDKKSMIHQVLKATCDNTVKNDFVQICKKYLKALDIDHSFEEIAKLSKSAFKKLLKEKSKVAAFQYLSGEKLKQKKICNIEYQKLDIQEYLLNGDRNVNVSKFIFKARSKTVDIKMQKKWKYDDILCSGCGENEETGEEILSCKSFGNSSDNSYSGFYSDNVDDQTTVAKQMMKRMKIRKKIREEVT